MPKIIGNTTATPNPRPDWNQTDETKADYIKNKPDLSKYLTADDVTGAAGNVENGDGKGAVQQVADGVVDGFYFANKNPHAANLDHNVYLWNEGIEYVPYGADGDYAIALGGKSYAKGKRSTAIGTTTIAIGNYSFASGDNTVALGDDSHTEGYKTTACGKESHAEGFDTIAQGRTSHSEGNTTVAYGEGSHAEGTQTKAEGDFSHAEGNSTEALALYSHTEGEHTKATARGSHAGGYFTIANQPYQTVVGKYNNAAGSSSVLFEVGNGKDANNRSNALTVYEDGSVHVAKSLIINGESGDDHSAARLIDLNEVKDRVSTLEDYLKYFQLAIAFYDYEQCVNSIVDAQPKELSVGQSIYIINKDVPDLWISYAGNEYVHYVCASDEQFLQDLSNSDGVLRIGYYGVSEAEAKNSNADIDMLMADIESALDGILAIQDSLIGGGV